MVPDPGHDSLRLGAIATGCAIDGTAYGEDLYVAPWARRSNVGPRLVFAFIEACKRTVGIEQVVLGRATEDASLDAFKASLGVPSRSIPARVTFRGPVERVVEIVLSSQPRLRERLYGS
jgi:hypothetical protein